MKLRNFIIILLLLSFIFSKDKEYYAEYKYTASKNESKEEAKEKAKSLAISDDLLEEIVALIGQSEISLHLQNINNNFSSSSRYQTSLQSMKIVRIAKTIDELWDKRERTFYIKLKVFADSDKIKENLEKQLDEIVNSKCYPGNLEAFENFQECNSEYMKEYFVGEVNCLDECNSTTYIKAMDDLSSKISLNLIDCYVQNI